MMEQRRDIVLGRTFAILSALGYGVGTVLTRRGVTDLTSPLAGSAVSLLAATLVLGIIAGRDFESDLMTKKAPILFFFLAGLGSGSGALLSFFALSKAPVVIASPIQNTHPLFTLLFAWMFLRRMEKIGLRLVLGAFFVVLGVALIIIGKNL